jgi:hypothetical protein
MITDADGIEVELIHNVRYTNVVTVKYADGIEKEVPLRSLSSSLGQMDLVKQIQILSKDQRKAYKK